MAAFEVPPSALLNDWKVPVILGAVSTIGILDQPSVEISGGMVISTDYKLTFATATLPLIATDAVIKVDGQNYTVRDVKHLADGTFSEAIMSKLT